MARCTSEIAVFNRSMLSHRVSRARDLQHDQQHQQRPYSRREPADDRLCGLFLVRTFFLMCWFMLSIDDVCRRFWSMSFLSSWVRKENEYKFLWGSEGHEEHERPRPQFSGKRVINKVCCLCACCVRESMCADSAPRPASRVCPYYLSGHRMCVCLL